jgi:NAD(P)H dehydrogenase (quinone)
MDILVVLCHPLPGSLNHATAERVVGTLTELGHRPRFHDLYGEGFDPVLSGEELRRGVSFDEAVLAHAGEVTACRGIVLIHPDWWGLPPALLKGWVDRVFRPGVVYEFEGEEFLRKSRLPLLGGHTALVFATSEASAEEDPGLLERFWREAVFRYCGIERTECRILRSLHRLEQGERSAWLRDVAACVRLWFPPESSPSAGPSHPEPPSRGLPRPGPG